MSTQPALVGQLLLLALVCTCIVHVLRAPPPPAEAPRLRHATAAEPDPKKKTVAAPAAKPPSTSHKPRRARPTRTSSPRVAALSSAPTAKVSCAVLSQWDDTHFSHDQDWVPLADGTSVQPSTLWQWVPARDGTGHLRNRASGGHLNYRPGGFVRGHGNRLPRRPARAGPTTP